MIRPDKKKDVINQLQKNILLWQGFTPPPVGTANVVGLGPVEAVFPNGAFPIGAIHEFLSTASEHTAASNGFIAGLLAVLMRQGGVCLWISASRILFPPALKAFGVEPDRIIFVDLRREKEVLWAMEEALKCEGLVAVTAEVRDISFTESLRLQLAAEQSHVTGFILRNDLRKINTTACAARWQITPLASEPETGMPGLGFPRWNVELLKVRNGHTGAWKMEWLADRFNPVTENMAESVLPLYERKAG